MGLLVPSFILLEIFVFDIRFTQAWVVLFGFFIMMFLIAIPKKFYNMQTLRAVRMIPQGVLLMFKNFFALKGANKSFIHTEHGTILEESQK